MLGFMAELLARSEFWTVIAGLAAVCSALVAWLESRARARDAKQYAAALQAVIDAGQYVTHLRGMEERMTSLNSAFEQLGRVIHQVSEHMKEAASASREAVDLANRHMEGALRNVETATGAVTEMSRSLTDIANAARRSQRESLRAHKELMKGIKEPGSAQESTEDA